METLQLHEVASDSEFSGKQNSIVFSSRFSVVKKLAEGGTSIIYLVRDFLTDSSHVVLKCVDSGLLRSRSTRDIATKEVAVARKLAHPNLVKVYDVGKDGKQEYIVMEYLRGDSLNNLLHRSKFDYAQSLSIIKPIVSALHYLHCQGIVHSDVKPSNIIVTYDDQVKLIDLANCRQDSNAKSPQISVSDNHFFGYSLDYSSPQVINDQPATTSDDVFSLACILYELLEGKSPVSNEKQDSTVFIASARKPKQINYWQWRVLKRALSVDHRKRFQSIEYFYRCFVKAKLIPFFSVCIFIGVLAFSLIGYSLWQSITAHSEKYATYEEVYHREQSVNDMVSAVRRQEPQKRYQYLSSLNQYPAILRHGALASLYDDVVPPAIEMIADGLLEQESIPKFSEFTRTVENLLVFYPRAQGLHELRNDIAKERNMLINNLTIQLSDIVNGSEYTPAEAVELDVVLTKFSTLHVSISDVLDESYADAYAIQLDNMIREQNWKSVGDLYGFAQSMSTVLPKYTQVWSRLDGNTAKYAKSLAAYIVQEDRTASKFPSDAGVYFLNERLNGLQESIERSWFNKDIKKYADQLVSLKDQYYLPAEFPPFKQTMDVLNNKIAEKIRYHKNRKQTKSAKLLTDLAKELS